MITTGYDYFLTWDMQLRKGDAGIFEAARDLLIEELEKARPKDSAETKDEFFLNALYVESKSGDVFGLEEMRWIDELDQCVWKLIAEFADGQLWIKGADNDDFQRMTFSNGSFKTQYGQVIYGDECDYVLEQHGKKMPVTLRKAYSLWLEKRKLLNGV